MDVGLLQSLIRTHKETQCTPLIVIAFAGACTSCLLLCFNILIIDIVVEVEANLGKW